MRILVTGATGSLGGVTARRLAALGHTVAATGRDLARGAALARDGIGFAAADLSDSRAIAELVRGQQAVIHCGGLSSPWGRAGDFNRINVEGTRAVVDAALANRARLVFVSSPSIYADYRDRLDITEELAPAARPVNAYAASKLAAERIVAAAVHRGLDAAIIRPRAIFGENDTALLPRLIRVASKGVLPLIDGGRAVVDLTYVGNAADVLMAAALLERPLGGRCYNISNGEPVTVADLYRRIVGLLGLRVRFINLPFGLAYAIAGAMEAAAALSPAKAEPLLTRYAIGAIGRSQTLSIAAARRDLGYRPLVSLDAGIRMTFQAWQSAHA